MSLMPIPGERVTFYLLLLLLVCQPLLTNAQDTGTQALVYNLQTAIKQKKPAIASSLSIELGSRFLIAGDSEMAKKYFLESLVFSKRAALPENTLTSSFSLGKIYLQSQDFNNAADYFSRSGELASAMQRHDIAYNSYIYQGESYAAQKRYKKAIEPIEKALRIAVGEHSIEKQVACYTLLGDYYLKSGNNKKASDITTLLGSLTAIREKEAIARAEANELYLEAMDAINQKTAQENVLIAQSEQLKLAEASLRAVEAVNEKSKLEIDLLSRERELAMLRIQEQSSRLEYEAIFRNAILVVIVMGSSLIGVLIINYRKKIKTNKRIDLQNKNIKSSINYAKRIQEAMLPKKEVQETLLKDSFILFKPRDVVSGDFYWFSPLGRDGGDLVFGAIDCTGHGVPGAFMSMIGINSLNSIVSRGITDTDQILETLHQEIRNALQQEVTGNNDGMDLSLCIYRGEQQVLEFSGAKSPLVYIQNGELFQIKGDVHSIGGSKSKPGQRYKKHRISIDRPTMVYLFTDGFRDQFGGQDNQKFMGKRFSNLLKEIHQLPLSDQYSILDRTFEEWKGSGEQTDDVLVMGVMLKPD